jgi:hypothetical protein
MLLFTSCHHCAVSISLFAALSGLGLLWLPSLLKQPETLEETERILLLMSFSYWLVYCVVFLVQKAPFPAEWEVFRTSLKMTTAITYFFTAACVISLPLTHFAASQFSEEE